MKKWIIALVASLLLAVATPAHAVSINSRGQITGCVAGGVAHIDGKVISIGAGGCNWVDDDTIIYQACDNPAGPASGCVVQTYNQVTGEKKTAYRTGAIEVTAGGGVWACFCDGGVHTSTGQFYADSSTFLNQSGQDGSFVLKVVYQGWGPYDGVDPNGTRWRITDGGVNVMESDFQILGNHRATWLDSRFGPSNNFGASIKWLGGWWLRSAFIDGKLWVMYQNDKVSKLFLHPADSFMGYIVTNDTLTYEPALRVLPDGRVRAAWSNDPSETPNGTKAVTVDMTAPRVDLSALVIAPPPPPPPPPPAGFPKNLLADIKAERAKYGALVNQAQAGELINAVAFKNKDLGFGLLRKDGGNNCPVAGLGVKVSCDWIVNSKTGTGCDVLGSGPDPDNAGPSSPSWCDGEAFDTLRFVAPVTPSGTEGGGGGGSIDPRIAELEKKVAEAEIKLAQVMKDFSQAIADRDANGIRAAELQAERDDLKAQLTGQEELIAKLRTDAANPCDRVTIRVVPGYLARFVGTRCEAK